MRSWGLADRAQNLGEADQSSSISPLDLFRFTANGVRSYSTATNIAPYFSITSSASRFVYFNQAGGGSDYSDWGDGVVPADGSGNNPPQMQDAFGTPGVDVNIGGNELASLDVVGWNCHCSRPGCGIASARAGIDRPSRLERSWLARPPAKGMTCGVRPSRPPVVRRIRRCAPGRGNASSGTLEAASALPARYAPARRTSAWRS